MHIVKKEHHWASTLSNRSSTNFIVLHHRAGTGTVESIHTQHLKQGWAGIGYHYYIRTDGTIYTGRPETTVGAHTVNYNSISIGVCFEGNYDQNNAMPEAQLKAGQELVQNLQKRYPTAKVVRHRDLQSTACPGAYFPFNIITTPAKEVKTMTLEEAKAIIKEHAKIDDTSLLYLSFYKYGTDLIKKLATGYKNMQE